MTDNPYPAIAGLLALALVSATIGFLVSVEGQYAHDNATHLKADIDSVQTKRMEGDTLYFTEPVEFTGPVVFEQDAIFQDSVAFGEGEVVFTEMPIVAYD